MNLFFIISNNFLPNKFIITLKYYLSIVYFSNTFYLELIYNKVIYKIYQIIRKRERHGTSAEETDQLHRSVKKHKRDNDLDEHGQGSGPHPQEVDMDDCTAWTGDATFADIVQGRHSPKVIYTSDDEEDPMDDLSLAEVVHVPDEKEAAIVCPEVDIPWDEYKSYWQPWRRALILKVLGKSFSFRALEPKIKTTWQLENDCELIDIEQGFIVARFYSREDYLKVLEGGPWTVFGHYLTISKWRPNFNPSDHSITTTLVWVRFMAVSLEIFKEAALMRLGNQLGKAVKVDTTTSDVVRGKYARVCIELDINRPLVTVVRVLGRLHAVEYEGFYKVCFHCGQLGHQKEQCPQLPTAHGGSHDQMSGQQPVLLITLMDLGYSRRMLGVGCNRRMIG